MTSPATNRSAQTSPWRVSLHGGHSGQFCAHAEGTLEGIVARAVELGFVAYGISEHQPRIRPEDLYREEVEAGITPELLLERFEAYARRGFPEAARRFQGAIELLLGMEIEVLPPRDYADHVRKLRGSFALDYVVGSVHHVHGIPIDTSLGSWAQAAARSGGVEALVVDYYRLVAEMVQSVRPEVVAHLDLVKLRAPGIPATDRVADALGAALDAVAASGALLEANARAFSKGLAEPYPSVAILRLARERGIPVTLGDDSHGPDQVGRDLERAKDAAVAAGYREIAYLAKTAAGLERRSAPLE